MLINSELPLTMLQDNLRLNEYDFVLFHLYLQYPEYREYYKELRRTHPDRLMILDNSAYEFFVKHEKLDLNLYKKAIIDLCPDYYILPDVLMDKEETLSKSFTFIAVHEIPIIQAFTNTGKKVPKPLAVAQGNSADELFDCLLKYYREHVRAIALPFHNSFYKEYYRDDIANQFRAEFGSITDDHRYAMGRIQFVRDAALLLKKFDHVHLLGSHCPYEKRMHPDWIKTFDTGYPVKCGIAGHELFKESVKPDIIIDDFMTKELSTHQQALIECNVWKFRNL